MTHQWQGECEKHQTKLADFHLTSMPTLCTVASEGSSVGVGVYAYRRGGKYLAALQASNFYSPDHGGMVLQAQHIVTSPEFYYRPKTAADYDDMFSGVIAGTIILSYGEMKASHVLIHLSGDELRSGERFIEAMRKHDRFAKAGLQGPWIYFSKSRVPN